MLSNAALVRVVQKILKRVKRDRKNFTDDLNFHWQIRDTDAQHAMPFFRGRLVGIVAKKYIYARRYKKVII